MQRYRSKIKNVDPCLRHAGAGRRGRDFFGFLCCVFVGIGLGSGEFDILRSMSFVLLICCFAEWRSGKPAIESAGLYAMGRHPGRSIARRRALLRELKDG